MEKITVVKIGGNVIDDPAVLKRFIADFAAMPGPKILVHGGGKVATRLAERLELVVQMVDGRRIMLGSRHPAELAGAIFKAMPGRHDLFQAR